MQVFSRILYAPFALNEVGSWFWKWPRLKPLAEEVGPEPGPQGPFCQALGVQRKVFLDERLLLGCLP